MSQSDNPPTRPDGRSNEAGAAPERAHLAEPQDTIAVVAAPAAPEPGSVVPGGQSDTSLEPPDGSDEGEERAFSGGDGGQGRELAAGAASTRRELGRGALASFPVCGIGASAGGIEALEALFHNLTPSGAAFVVVQHLAPYHESKLVEMLARATTMRVLAASDGVEVAPDTVYVIPPACDLAILHGVLHMMPAPTTKGPRLSIDFFLRSLAVDRGANAIGVVLSGTGSDGTFGLKAIKAEGGISLVQDPVSARHDGMPRSAIEAGVADFCLPPDEIAAELARVLRHPYLARRAPAGIPLENLNKLFVLIRTAFGNDLTGYKHSTIERRIERRMALHKIERLDDYVRFVQSDADELAVLYRDILINVTSFFRDRAPFDELKNVVFPSIMKRKKPGDAIRFWSAGCSTGEEAYSIAMCLLEFLGDRAHDYRLQGFGTDVEQHSITRARQGLYPQNIATDVSVERLHRFFVARDRGFQVNRMVRDVLVFAVQNLTKDAPFSRLDLVTCRNVLIYLQPVLQKKVLRILHYSLNPEGVLMLGTSETVGDSPDLFSLTDRKNKLYSRKSVVEPRSDFSFAVAPLSFPERPRGAQESRPGLSLQQLADRKVIERYSPPGLLLNENLEILQYRGRMAPYLDPAPGAATLHVLKHVRPELHGDLRMLLHKVLQQNTHAAATGVRVGGRGAGRDDGRGVNLEVFPIQDPDGRGRCLLVLFSEAEPRARDEASEATSTPDASTLEPRVGELERELALTKDYLQSTIEELETSNEELKSSNEELQSSNEELQSTNEELETSKEELQSANEELTTVNDELQNRMSDLGSSNDDLNNVLAGVDRPVLLVGIDRRIRRFSYAAERLFNLLPADIGRSVSMLRGSLGGADLDGAITDVISRVSPVELEVFTPDGWYLMRISPYKTVENSIRGAVVYFREETQARSPGEGGARWMDPAFPRAFLRRASHPLLVLDERLNVVWANGPVLEALGANADDVLGAPLGALAGGRLADPRLSEMVAEVAASGSPFRDLALVLDGTGGSVRELRASGRLLPAAKRDGRRRLVLLSLEPRLEVEGAS
jgi:two-component system, chemotaxis family, CheB/CheR fusion protein